MSLAGWHFAAPGEAQDDKFQRKTVSDTKINPQNYGNTKNIGCRR